MGENLNYAQRLLEEFGSICHENEIEYKVAWGPEMYGSGVLMSAADCRKFMAVVDRENREHRALESWENSPEYPQNTVRYVGTDSLCYNILDYTSFLYHGIFVEINVVRDRASSMKDKMYAAVERGIQLNSYNFATPKDKASDSKSLKIYHAFLKTSGGEAGVRRKCMEHILKGPAFSVESKTADNYKPKTYTAAYVKYLVINESMDSIDYFKINHDALDELSGAPLNEMRKVKKDIDSNRRANNINLDKAQATWDMIRKVDEELKGTVETKTEE